MYLVEKEIRTQFDALKKTVAHAQSCAEAAAAAFAGTEKLCVLGCGSSFSLAKSAATQFSQHTGIPAFALPAGDLLVNFDAYEKMICGSTVLLLSRSGSTSEVLRAAGLCRTQCRCRILSICAKADAPVEELADWSLVIPWAFDEAVCQTRTVSNLYAAALALICMVSGDENELHCLSAADTYAEAFCRMEEERLAAIAAGEWTRAVVLADSGCHGLAEEGALAFKEICRRDSNHYHLLDVRHGPMVQIGEDTLVIAWVSSGDARLQRDLLQDIAKKTSHLVLLNAGDQDLSDLSGFCMQLPDCGPDEVKMIFALYCIQMICFRHALIRGVDPDQPEGLDAWIKL